MKIAVYAIAKNEARHAGRFRASAHEADGSSGTCYFQMGSISVTLPALAQRAWGF